MVCDVMLCHGMSCHVMSYNALHYITLHYIIISHVTFRYISSAPSVASIIGPNYTLFNMHHIILSPQILLYLYMFKSRSTGMRKRVLNVWNCLPSDVDFSTNTQTQYT